MKERLHHSSTFRADSEFHSFSTITVTYNVITQMCPDKHAQMCISLLIWMRLTGTHCMRVNRLQSTAAKLHVTCMSGADCRKELKFRAHLLRGVWLPAFAVALRAEAHRYPARRRHLAASASAFQAVASSALQTRAWKLVTRSFSQPSLIGDFRRGGLH